MPGTSQLWTYLIVPSTSLPFSGERLLELGSWLTGMAALLILAFVVRRFSGSSLLQRPAIVFALVALPLLVNPFFARHLTTGMDTMLSFLTNTLLAWAVLRNLRRPSEWSATLVGVLSVLTVFARPDNIIVALGVPTAAWLLAG
ncbi:MAG: hypothetical protein QOI59_907 [Gammaproteobacteria bacterium]|jgi:hypothetical protein|nr:hypothetical protein [Gammaproteobacteria bacterium]